MNPVKIAVLGGSGVATPELVNALLHKAGRTQAIELALVGRSASKLETVGGIARLLAGQEPLLKVTWTTEAQAALEGADFVLNQIRVGGLEARRFDESFPNDLGIPGEETVGPGGFANASRTIPVVLEYARLIEKICPAALVLTFANPSSMIQYAITCSTRLKTIGLCDAPVSLFQAIARALHVPEEELVCNYTGMHHFGWVTGVWHHGLDRLPEALAKSAEIVPDVAPELVQALGVLPGHYLNYIFHPDRMLHRKLGKRTRAEELLELQEELLVEFERALAAGQKPAGLARRKARWYEAIIAPVLLALVEGRMNPARQEGRYTPRRFVLDVVNGRDGMAGQPVPWLPAEAVVEVPAYVENGCIHPLAAGNVPAWVKLLLQANCAYEMKAVEAIVARDRTLALGALLLNPMIHSYDQACAVLARAWG